MFTHSLQPTDISNPMHKIVSYGEVANMDANAQNVFHGAHQPYENAPRAMGPPPGAYRQVGPHRAANTAQQYPYHPDSMYSMPDQQQQQQQHGMHIIY